MYFEIFISNFHHKRTQLQRSANLRYASGTNYSAIIDPEIIIYKFGWKTTTKYTLRQIVVGLVNAYYTWRYGKPSTQYYILIWGWSYVGKKEWNLFRLRWTQNWYLTFSWGMQRSDLILSRLSTHAHITLNWEKMKFEKWIKKKLWVNLS